MQAKQEISSAETEIKTADLKIRDNTEQLKKKQLEMKKTEAEYKRDSNSLGIRYFFDCVHCRAEKLFSILVLNYLSASRK
jgi:hypothetical protein